MFAFIVGFIIGLNLGMIIIAVQVAKEDRRDE